MRLLARIQNPSLAKCLCAEQIASAAEASPVQQDGTQIHEPFDVEEAAGRGALDHPLIARNSPDGVEITHRERA
jgi:hypothetical protein